MSRRTYPVPNKNLSGGDYIENRRAKELFSGTSNLAKTIEQQNGNFPLLTPLGKLKPYQGTYGLSGRSVDGNKNYCLNTSHSYRDLLAITKGKYLITPPNIADDSIITFNDVSDAQKLYNGLYYVYNYNSNNLIAYMNPAYPTTPASYVLNQIQYNVSSDANQRIIVDPSYVITYISESCILHPKAGRNISINNDAESRYSFNRTINLELLTGFQYPVKFELDYDEGDCINVNNDIQAKYAFPVPPVPPVPIVFLNTGGSGTDQTIIAWSDNAGVTWVASDNANSIFRDQVNSVKFGNQTWVAVGGNSNAVDYTDPSSNVIAYSDSSAGDAYGKTWTPSISSLGPSTNANYIFEKLNSSQYYSPVISKWIVVGKGRTITISSNVVTPTIAYSSNLQDWTIASSPDASLNYNPFGTNGIGIALATNNDSTKTRTIAVGTGTMPGTSTNINMVVSTDGGVLWKPAPIAAVAGANAVNNPPFTNTYPPECIIYSETSVFPPALFWHVGGTSDGSTISPIYYSNPTYALYNITWTAAKYNGSPVTTGTCYGIAHRSQIAFGPYVNYVAVGDNIFGVSNIVYSIDGENWFASSNGNDFKPRSVIYYEGAGIWVAVGSKNLSGANVIAYSTNAINWTNSLNGDGLFVNGALGVGSV